MSVACVHGIGTGTEARRSLAVAWRAALARGAAGGLDVVLHAAAWSSTGSPTRDLARLFFSGCWDQWVDEVASVMRRRRVDVVLAHSLGAAIAPYAMQRAGIVDVPLVVFGPPWTHPAYSAALRARGIAPAARADCLLNPDDGVAASMALRGHRGAWKVPEGWRLRRVDVDFVPGHPFTEHAVEHYLHSVEMRDALVDAQTRGGMWTTLP